MHKLEEEAMRMLENPSLLPKEDAILKFYEPILRLWTYPSFSPYKVWVFCEPNFRTINPSDLIIRKVIWDRHTDLDRLANPLEGLKKGFDTEPRLVIRSTKVEREIYENLYSKLNEIKFSAFASEGTFGVDGESYGIESFCFSNSTRVSWWSVYSDEWQNLVEWFRKTTEFLENKFSDLDQAKIDL